MFLPRFSYAFFVFVCLFSIVLLLREHAGTLYFTREYACWHFHAHKGVDSFDSVILSVFASVFLHFWDAKIEEIRRNAGSKAKVASRARFGALLADFWPLGRALLASLGRPEALLGRFGAAFGGQKVKNSAWPKLPGGFWRPKPSQEVKIDPLRGNFLWIFMIFEGFTRQKCDSSKTCLKKHNFYLHKSHVRCLLCR